MRFECGCSDIEKAHSFRLAVIVPFYKSYGHAKPTFSTIAKIQDHFGISAKTVVVLDGPDEVLREEIELGANEFRNLDITLVELAKNFGVGPAIRAGLSRSEACGVVCFGSDGQEPLSLLLDLSHEALQDENRLALGTRINRGGDPLLAYFTSRLYWRFASSVLRLDVPAGGIDVFSCGSRVARAILGMGGLRANFTSTLLSVGFSPKFFEFERLPRISGNSAWTFSRRVSLFLDSAIDGSEMPIRFISVAGFMWALVSSILMVGTVVERLLGNVEVPGYTTILLVLSTGLGLTILSLGIVGEYLVRAFMYARGNPVFVEKSVLRLNSDRHASGGGGE